MRTYLRNLTVLGLIAGMGLTALAAESATALNGAVASVNGPVMTTVAAVKNPVLSKQRYDVIMSNLDQGGDLLVVANMDGWIKEMVRESSSLSALWAPRLLICSPW